MYSQVILAISIILQAITVLFALRLIGISGRSRSWYLIAAAIMLMALRRIMGLIGLEAGTNTASLENTIALATSLLMLWGISQIEPLLRSNEEARRALQHENEQRQKTETDLRESERRLSTLMSNLPGMAYRCQNDEQWTMEFISDGCEELTGHTPDDLIANRIKSFSDLIHPDDRQPVWDQIQVANQTHKPFQIMYRITTAQGEVKWVWEQGVTIQTKGSDQLILEGFITDITAQKTTEAVLQQEKELYRCTFEAIPASASMWTYNNGQFTLLQANHSAARLLNGQETIEVGRDVQSIFHDDPWWLMMMNDVITSGNTCHDERWHTLPDAPEPHWIAVHCARISEDRLLLILFDQTEEARAKEKLQHSEALLRSILVAVPAGLGLVKERVFSWTNQRFQDMLDYSADELRHQSARIIYPNEEDYLAVGEEKYALIARDGTGSVQTRMQRKNGEIINVLLSSSPVDKNDWSQGVVFAVLDITEMEQARTKLRESEERYRLLANHSADVIWTLDLEGRFTYISPSVERLRGFTVEDAMQQTIAESLTPESYEVALSGLQTLRQAIDSGIPQKTPLLYELEQPRKDGSTVWTEVAATTMYDDTGTFVGILGVTRDITQRRLMDEALRAQIRRNQQTLETMLDGYLIADKDGHLHDVNASYCEMMGYTRQEILAMTLYDLEVRPEGENVPARIEEVLQQGALRFETHHRAKDGRLVTVEVSATTMEVGSQTFVVAFLRNITEQRTAEAQALEINRLFRDTFELAGSGISNILPDGRFILVNQSLCDIVGYSKEELLTMRHQDITHPDDVQATLENTQQILGGQAEQFSITKRFIHKNSSILWVTVNTSAIRNEDGTTKHLICVSEDITERKRIEEALRYSEEKFSKAFLSSPDSLTISTLDDGRFVEVNDTFLAYSGYTREEVIGRSAFELGIGVDPETFKQIAQDVTEQRPVRNRDMLYSIKSSETRAALISAETIMLDGQPYLLTIAKDIQDRVEAENALRNSEARYRVLLETAPVGIALISTTQKFLALNPAMTQITGYTMEELDDLEITSAFTDPEICQQLIDQILKKGSLRGHEIDIKRRNGNIFRGRISVQLFDWQESRAAIVLLEDVTEQVDTRAALVSQMRRNQQILSTMQDGYVLASADGRILDVNPAYCGIVGHSREELLDRSLFDLDTDLWHMLPQILAQENSPTQTLRSETHTRHKSGRLVETETNVVIMEEAGKTFLGCFVRDITQRKEVEHALRSSETKFRSAFNSSGVGMGLATLEGRFLEVNPKLSDMLGYSAEELLEMTFTDVTHPADILLSLSASQRLLSGTCDSLTIEKRYLHRDGQTVWSDSTIALVHDEQHIPAYLIFQIKDITDRKTAEQTLAQERNLLRTLIDSLPDMIYVKDIEGRFITVNQATSRLVGVSSPEQLIGKTDRDIYAQELIEQFHVSDREVLEFSRRVENREEFVYDADNNLRWILTTKLPLFNSDGQLSGLVGIGRDITEMRHILDAERDQRVLAEALLDSAMILNQSLDMETILDQLLAKISEVVPHDAADIRLIEDGYARVVRARGYPSGNITPNAENYRLKIQDVANLRTMLEGSQPVIIDDTHDNANWIIFKDYDASLHAFLGAPIRWKNEVIGFIQLLSANPGYFNKQSASRLEAFAAEAAIAIQNARLYAQIQQHAADLEQRVLERTVELRDSEARYRAIVEDQLELVIRHTPDRQITFANEAACRFAGQTAEELRGANMLNLFAPSESMNVNNLLSKLSKDNPELVSEHHFVDTDDNHYWIQWTARVILDENEEVFEIQSVGRDVTTLKEMEAQLRQALERELEINELRSRFLSMAAHDMRNPLAVIQSAVDLLAHYRDQLTEDQQHKRLQDIQTSIHTMVRLLDDLLTIGQVEAGKLDFDPAALDLVPFCRKVIEDISLTTGRYNEIRLETHNCDRKFILDSKLLWHILSNLLSNAIKYSEEGTPVDLKVTCHDETLTIQVQDYGIGIPEDEQADVFKAFHRFSNVGRTPGTGLGLAIVKRAVDLHEATIAFASGEGKGSTFTIDIPLIQGKAELK